MSHARLTGLMLTAFFASFPLRAAAEEGAREMSPAEQKSVAKIACAIVKEPSRYPLPAIPANYAGSPHLTQEEKNCIATIEIAKQAASLWGGPGSR